MQERFKEHLDQKSFFSKEDKLLVAVSGGVDSMVLTHLLIKGGFNIAIAHCNYQLRENSSELDEQLVRVFGEKLGVTVHVKKIETEELSKSSNSSVQMVARETRYAFFEELMNLHNYRFTLLAHTADDRLETLIINILRGTGIRGFQGMPEIRDRYVRPLMFAHKSEVRSYADQNQVEFREDESNFSIKYVRNWVRLRVIPMLRAYDSSNIKKLQAFIERTAVSIPEYDRIIQGEIARISSKNDKELLIQQIQELRFPFTVLKEILKPIGFSSEQVFEVLDLCDSVSGSMIESDSFRIVKDRECLLIHEKSQSSVKPKLFFEVFDRSEFDSLKTGSFQILVDAELIQEPSLVLRKWQTGDKFKPFGMNGWKKLSDFFIDEKLSVIEKENTWILAQNKAIIWVIGMRMDNRFRVSDKTQKILKITASE